MSPVLARLVDDRCWRPSTVVRDVLVADVTEDEAAELATSEAARAALEAWFVARRQADPTLRGLVGFVTRADGAVIGFLELTGDGGDVAWSGPHAPLGPLFA